MRISDWSSDVCSSDLQTSFPIGSWPVAIRTFRWATFLSSSRNAASFSHSSLSVFHSAGGGVYVAEAGVSNARSEERRVGKEWSVRVDLGGGRIIKKKKK